MIRYFDTSALVKIYCSESDSEKATGMLANTRVAACSRIAYAELYSAVNRKMHEGALSRREIENLRIIFDRDWSSYFIIDVSAEVVALAAELTGRHCLRAYDAIHIASAIMLKERTGTGLEFVSFDREQKRAAGKEGLIIV